MKRSAKLSRERTSRLCWLGSADSEVAVLRLLGVDVLPDNQGVAERWLQVPASKIAAIKAVLADHGATLLPPEGSL